MNTTYEVALLVHELAGDRLSPSDHISAEVRFAKALESACAPGGGVVPTYINSNAWRTALAKAEAETWQDRAKPAGAAFSVRIVDARLMEVQADVPF
jgi:hypothetical protein